MLFRVPLPVVWKVERVVMSHGLNSAGVGSGGYSGTVLVVGQCYLEEGASAAAGWT